MNVEKKLDKKLNITTCGRDASAEDTYHYPYEPTPYVVLERLAETGYINKENILVDYGCGKGRVGFYMNHMLGCRTRGVDFDERMINEALENLKKYGKEKDVKFVCQSAEKYEVQEADCFYFFNPFAVEILQTVIGKIKESYYDNPRKIYLFFYYPSDEYVAYLMSVREICFADEIDCGDLFAEQNERERIIIFETD